MRTRLLTAVVALGSLFAVQMAVAKTPSQTAPASKKHHKKHHNKHSKAVNPSNPTI
jgi:hypothetical protein